MSLLQEAQAMEQEIIGWRRYFHENPELGLELPKTAAKVLNATDRIVSKDHLTTLMITHNMRDAIAHGNRLIMMHDGRIILDIRGDEKQKLTVEDLMHEFEKISGEAFASDKALLG